MSLGKVAIVSPPPNYRIGETARDRQYIRSIAAPNLCATRASGTVRDGYERRRTMLKVAQAMSDRTIVLGSGIGPEPPPDPLTMALPKRCNQRV